MSQASFPMTTASEPGSPVYFDANPLSDRHLTGIGRYEARLALAMAAHRPVRFFKQNELVMPPADLSWSQDQDLGEWARTLMTGERVPFSQPPQGSIGIWPLLRPIERTFDREVTILHDLTPLILPQTHKQETRSHFQGLCARAITSSDIALAVSHSTASDASWLAEIDPSRIVVAHSGPSLCVGHHADETPVERKSGIGLIVSTLEPRKNPQFLFDWFYSSKVLPDDAELWWVGPDGWLTSKEKLEQYEQQPGSDRRVKFLGVVSDSELCQLYRTVEWSIYPSLYEGFGFPVLDSLRHGTPVLTSYNSSLREFDSKGLYFFDPCDPGSVDDAWRQWQAETPVSIARDRLERQYSWDNVARTILESCADVVAFDQESSVAA